MVRIRIFITGVLTGALLFAGAALAENQLKIFINGNTIDTDGAYISDGTTYIPLRAVAEALGADVEWDQENYSISITSNSILKMRLDDNEILKNPSEHADEFEIVLEAVANSWNDNIVSNTIYEKLSGQAKTTVEQILSYKFEFGEIPQALNNAFSKYWTEDKNDTNLYKSITDVFDIESSDSGFILKQKTSN